MALKKPSELLNKKETSGVFEKPEVSSHITESYDKFRNNFEKVNELSEKVEVLTQELSEKLTKSDLENAMLSQLMVLDENFKELQNEVKGLNKQDLKEFKETVSNLSEIVDNLVETELPRYKKQITKNELYVGEQVHQLQEVVEINILGIREEIDEKFGNIADVVDNNIEYFNQKLEETSSQVKKTTETYHNLSKIVENKVSKENERLEEYSEIIESLTQAFEELSGALKEELNTSSQLTEEKFEEYRNQFESISSGLEKSIDNRLEGYRKELVDVKAEVAINEQHIKNVDKYLQENHQELEELKEEVFSEIEKLPVGNLQENLERLEKKIDFIKETYSKIEPDVVVKEVIKEGLLNEPPSTDNKDPLTPLDQNFVTLDQLQQHYRLFLNRIQQQLSTLGGGGETRLKYLDDIVGIATNASAYDGKFLKYNDTLGKFEFVDILESQTLNDVLSNGNTSALGMSVGVVTAIAYYGDGSNLSNIISGVGIQSGGTIIGTGITTLNFVGSANTFSISGSTATITIAGNSVPVTKLSAASFNPNTFSADTVTVNSSTSVGYAITGLSPFQVITFDIDSIGGTTTSSAVQCGAEGTVSGTISFTAAGVAYTAGSPATQTIRFISGGDIVTKNWDVIIVPNPIAEDTTIGWDASADTYSYYTYGTSTKILGLGVTSRDYKNLDVQSRMRRCVISTGGTVQYYLDADDSTKKSGDWLRIVERQGLDNAGVSTHYTGIHTEAAHPRLRLGVSAWSAGTYILGQRVTHNGSLWECVASSTTTTPAAGTLSADLSGTDGDVMVEIPAFSVRHTKSGDVHTFQVRLGTNVSGTDYEVHPAFIKSDNSYRDYIYMGAYQGTGGTTSGALTSVSGVSNVVNATRGTFRTATSGRGTGWHQLSHYELSAVQFLMVTEFDSVNIQKVLGNGAMQGNVYVVNTGLSNSSGNKSQNANTSGGSTADYISYRGLENIYGRAWQWSDGINANGTSIYLNKNWTTWVDDTSTNYTLLATTVPAGVSASYQTDFMDENNVLLPSAASGGSATTYIADGLWTSTGWRVSAVSGSALNGSLDGPFCLNLYNASSYAATAVCGRLSWAPV